MTSFASNFNDISIDVRRASSLTRNVKYAIERAALIESKYGPTVLLTLQTTQPEVDRFKLFLGKRYVPLFTREILDQINTEKKLYQLEYCGTVGEQNAPKYLISEVN